MNITKIQVENMRSPRTNNKVANQFIIKTDQGVYFQSYETIIAFKSNVKNATPALTLDKQMWDYSATTLKYLKLFLEHYMGQHYLSKKDIKEKTESGEYHTEDLN